MQARINLIRFSNFLFDPPLRWFSILVLSLISVLFAFWLCQNPSISPPNLGFKDGVSKDSDANFKQKPVLFIKEQDLFFGEVWEEKEFHWRAPYTNISNHPVEIVGFEKSCGCVNIEPPPLKIQPGESHEIKLTFDLTGKNDQGKKINPWGFEVLIAPRLKGEKNSIEPWKFNGRVRRGFNFDPNLLDFKEDIVKGENPKSKKIEFSSFFPLTQINSSSNVPWFEFIIHHKVDPLSRSWVEVIPKENIPLGIFSANVNVSGKTKSGELVRGSFQVKGRVLQDIYIVPEMLSFGAQELNQTLNDIVVVKSRKNV